MGEVIRMRDVGKNIKDLRIKANMTQEELAEKLFVTRQTISNYENGKSRPDVDMIVKIGEILDTDANTVIYGITKNEGGKYTGLRFVISTIVVILLGVILIWLNTWVTENRSNSFLRFPYSLVNLLVNPAAFAAFGWWFLDVLSVYVRFRQLKHSYIKYIRLAIVCSLILLLVVILPYVVFVAIGDYRILTEENVSMHFPYIPIFSEMMRFLIIFNLNYSATYLLFGVILRILGFPQKKK